MGLSECSFTASSAQQPMASWMPGFTCSVRLEARSRCEMPGPNTRKPREFSLNLRDRSKSFRAVDSELQFSDTVLFEGSFTSHLCFSCAKDPGKMLEARLGAFFSIFWAAECVFCSGKHLNWPCVWKWEIAAFIGTESEWLPRTPNGSAPPGSGPPKTPPGIFRGVLGIPQRLLPNQFLGLGNLEQRLKISFRRHGAAADHPAGPCPGDGCGMLSPARPVWGARGSMVFGMRPEVSFLVGLAWKMDGFSGDESTR